MKSLNPAKILRERKQESERRAEALALFTKRLQVAFKKQNKAERTAFVEKLKVAGVSASDLKRLAEEAIRDTGTLIRWERKAVQENKAMTLAEVRGKSAFSKILSILRELYAEDIAEDISFDDAAKVVTQEVLLHP